MCAIPFECKEISSLLQRSRLPGSDRTLNLNSRALLPAPHIEEGFRAGFVGLSEPESPRCTYDITQLHTAVLTVEVSLREMRGQEGPLLSRTSTSPAAHSPSHANVEDVQLASCGFSTQPPFDPCLLPAYPIFLLSASPFSSHLTQFPHAHLKHLARYKTEPPCSIPPGGDEPPVQSDVKAGRPQ